MPLVPEEMCLATEILRKVVFGNVAALPQAAPLNASVCDVRRGPAFRRTIQTKIDCPTVKIGQPEI